MNRDDRITIARGARRELGRRSLSWFARYLWDVVPMTRSWMPSVAFEAVCAALQAVADGRIRLLLIAQPPGTAKSVLGAVLFPAYLFLKGDGAERVMCGSFSHDFALRDATRCRDVMNSARYRDLVGDAWRIRRFPDRVDDFWLTNGGRRMIVSPKGRSMGERCTVQVIDDPISALQAYSAAAKRDATRWVSTALTTRLEVKERDRRVMFMQRLSTDDPAQWAIDRGWKVLDLTAIFGRDANLEPMTETPCELYDDRGELVWRDTRADGATISPLLSEIALRELRIDMGSAMFAAQYLQRPQDDSAAMFRRAWFENTWTASETPESFDSITIALDASFKEALTADYAVIQVWAALGAERWLLEQWRRQAGFVETLNALLDVCERYPTAKTVIESAANGPAVFDAIRRDVPGVVDVPAKGGKESRAATIIAACEAGNVRLPAKWPDREIWIDEVCSFPNAPHDDQVDAMVHALRDLQGANAWPDYSALRRG